MQRGASRWKEESSGCRERPSRGLAGGEMRGPQCQVCTVQFDWIIQLQKTVSKEVPVLNHEWEQEDDDPGGILCPRML